MTLLHRKTDTIWYVQNSALLPIAALLLLLSGCSAAPKTYSSSADLVAAYNATGGSCEKISDVLESMVGEGAHAKFCMDNEASDPITMLLVFDKAEQQTRYIASTRDGGSESDIVSGERWVIVGGQAAALADKLGGSLLTS